MNRQLVFTAFNRTEYFTATLQSWNLARNLRSWQTTFFVEPSDVRDQMNEIALQLDTDVTVINNETQLGVLVNPWTAINYAFEVNQADFVVLAEDDVIVSHDVLEFFEWTSEEYSTASDILCLNAFSRIGGGRPNQITREANFSPLVWGVWRNRWETTLRDTWDKDYSTGNPDGSEAGWDWNINRIITNNGYSVIKPIQSRSDHIGEFDGTHMTPDMFEASKGSDFQLVRGRQRYNEV